MQYIETIDENGNHWKLETLAQEKYPHKGVLHLTINNQKFKVMNFVTARERNFFWDLLKKHFHGEIKDTESTSEVNNAENEH